MGKRTISKVFHKTSLLVGMGAFLLTPLTTLAIFITVSALVSTLLAEPAEKTANLANPSPSSPSSPSTQKLAKMKFPFFTKKDETKNETNQILRHEVKYGETLTEISVRYRIPIKYILRKNPKVPIMHKEVVFIPIKRIVKKPAEVKKPTGNEAQTKNKAETKASANTTSLVKTLQETLLKPKSPVERAAAKTVRSRESIAAEDTKNTSYKIYKQTVTEAKSVANGLNLNFQPPSYLRIARKFSLTGTTSHPAIEFFSKNTSSVYASNNGKVIFSGTLRGFGHTVIILHAGNFVSITSGLQKVLTTNSTLIKAGQILGLSSKKFSYALVYKGMPLNPITFF